FYYSVDEAGNVELENSQEFKLDLERPEPVLSANFTKVYVDEDIIFNASQSSDFNGISKYYFNFGDGNTTGWISDAVVSHNYSEAGIYDVTLKVRDNSGSINTRRENVTLTINNKPKKSEEEGWASFSMMIGLIILFIVIILIAAASYMRKRRRYPRPRAAYAARTSSRRRPARYYYEDEIAVEPEIIWDEDEVYSDSGRRYEEDYYYDEEYPEPYSKEEYWDEDYEPEEEYYEDYRDEEDVAWEEDSEGEEDVEWDEEYDEPEEDYYDDRRTRRSEWDEEYDDREYYNDYDEPSYSRQAYRSESRPPPPVQRRRKRLTPSWRKKHYKRRRPGLLDTEDANIGEYDEDEADEF
ncbi:MAG: PKD domain-containing protein, partial [Thermoplasmata archaeon]|nr:PKD domain-containing protein [Thermoplasmata archaeon]